MSKIIVVGSSNTDLIIKTDRIPKPGETVMGGVFHTTGGGKGANQAIAVARLGGDVKFIARVGNDLFGSDSLKRFEADGIDTSSIIIDKEHASGVALISVDSKGENSIVVAAGANGALCPEDIDMFADDIRKADYVLMQLEIPMKTVEYVTSIAYAAGVKVVINPAPAAALSDEVLSKTFLVTPNETECEILTGMEMGNESQLSAAADTLLAKGVKNVIVTLGSKGSWLKNAEQNEFVAARKVQAVDTTAAGDVYNGALCVALSEGRSMVDAMRFATKSSAVSVTRFGAQTSIPARCEVDNL